MLGQIRPNRRLVCGRPRTQRLDRFVFCLKFDPRETNSSRFSVPRVDSLPRHFLCISFLPDAAPLVFLSPDQIGGNQGILAEGEINSAQRRASSEVLGLLARLGSDIFTARMVPVLNSHVYSINDNVTVEEAAAEYGFVIRQLVKARTIDVSERNDCPKFDLILLGMGPDGHVASLFPHHPALEQREDWITYITDSPKPPPERITFTLPVINSASNVAVVVTGEEKANAVHLAIAGNEGSDISLLPARMVQPTDGKLVWFLDNAAASVLHAHGDTGKQHFE